MEELFGTLKNHAMIKKQVEESKRKSIDLKAIKDDSSDDKSNDKEDDEEMTLMATLRNS